MNILLVNRGSQGDIYPYLALAQGLQARGHNVTYSLPRIFEKQARDAGVNYFVQAFDDIKGMVEAEPDSKDLLKWVGRVIKDQFAELVPILKKYDVLIAENTEFAVSHIAEYCRVPLIRTHYGPYLPSDKIPPPVFPFPRPNKIFTPKFLWGLLNGSLKFMALKEVNRGRASLGMKPIKDQAKHSTDFSDNFLMYSRYLGNTDTQTWNRDYKWHIGGYCFHDNFPYNHDLLDRFTAFVKKDRRPTLFFTLGSCNDSLRDRLADNIYRICEQHNYKLVVGCGWWKVGSKLHSGDHLFLLDEAIPHNLVLPHVDAVIHHGGSGTTHSSARAGKPQMVAPLIIDQFYWAYRTQVLALGPGAIKMNVNRNDLERKVLDLMSNPIYKQNAAALGEQVRSEHGLDAICNCIESYASPAESLAAAANA